MYQEVVTLECAGVAPNTLSMTDLSESHGASQIEVTNKGITNNAMSAKRVLFSFP